MAYSLYNIRYLKAEKQQSLCTVTLTAEDIEKLKEAIRELYYFEFSVDDLRKLLTILIPVELPVSFFEILLKSFIRSRAWVRGSFRRERLDSHPTR